VQNNVWLQEIGSTDHGKRMLMGITSVFVFVAGKITGVKFRQVSEVEGGRSLATIESVKYFGSVNSPVAGRIAGFNEKLLSNPGALSVAPYDSWIAEYERVDSASLEKLPFGEKASDALLSRIKELRVRCFSFLPDEEMYAIGSECVTTLANLDELLEKRPGGYVVHLVTDDPTADIELVRWSMQTGNELAETRREDNLYHFILRKKK
jgi:glycine cleavage system H lipoate-binding protein/TusA-related sulfurtransferase